MNKHQLDRLFEEKLGAVQQEPSDKAKARFDQLLAQKHKKPVLIWWQVAAAVLLLAVSTVAYLNWPAGQEQPLTADLPEKATQLAESTSDDDINADGFDSGASKNDQTASENDITAIENDKTALENRAIALENDTNASENDKTERNSLTVANNPMTSIAVVEKNDAADVEAEQDTQALQTDLDAVTDGNIAVADNNENAPEVTAEEESTASISTQELEEALDSKVALAVNEPKAVEAPKKKRLPVTIIYKSSNADQSLVAMQDIRDDVDSLADERSNSLKSILQNAGNGSILAEFKKAKEDLFNLDIPLKTKKVEN